MAEKEKTVYIVNKSFVSHNIGGTIIPHDRFVAVSSTLLDTLNKNAVFSDLVKRGELVLKDEIDDSMRTTEEQLRDAKAEIARLKEEKGDSKELETAQKELADVKQEALDTIAAKDKALSDKDDEIARLKEQLAKLSPAE